MKTTIFVAGLLLLFLGCSSHQASPTANAGGVHLTVVAIPRQGFAPLRVSFHVTLDGVDDHNESYYCMKEEWDFGDGAVSSEKPDCAPFDPDTKITKEFFVDHLFNNTGVYSVHFKLGDHLQSNVVGVSVLENRTGVGP